MTPTEYEARCAEMLRANAHNMSAEEIERFAYGAGDPAIQLLGAQHNEFVHGCLSFTTESDSLDFIVYDAMRVIR